MKKNISLFIINFFIFLFFILFNCSLVGAEIKFGTKIVVIKGFYKNCTGIVTDQMDDQTVVPSVKLYWVDLVCKDDDGKDRNVGALLLESEIQELRFKHCDKNTCDNRQIK